MHIVFNGMRGAGGFGHLYAYDYDGKVGGDIHGDALGGGSKYDLGRGLSMDWGCQRNDSLRRAASRIVRHLFDLDRPNWDFVLMIRRPKWQRRLVIVEELLTELPRVDWHRSHLAILAVIFPKNWLLRWWWTWKIKRRKLA